MGTWSAESLVASGEVLSWTALIAATLAAIVVWAVGERWGVDDARLYWALGLLVAVVAALGFPTRTLSAGRTTTLIAASFSVLAPSLLLAFTAFVVAQVALYVVLRLKMDPRDPAAGALDLAQLETENHRIERLMSKGYLVWISALAALMASLVVGATLADWSTKSVRPSVVSESRPSSTLEQTSPEPTEGTAAEDLEKQEIADGTEGSPDQADPVLGEGER